MTSCTRRWYGATIRILAPVVVAGSVLVGPLATGVLADEPGAAQVETDAGSVDDPLEDDGAAAEGDAAQDPSGEGSADADPDGGDAGSGPVASPADAGDPYVLRSASVTTGRGRSVQGSACVLGSNGSVLYVGSEEGLYLELELTDQDGAALRQGTVTLVLPGTGSNPFEGMLAWTATRVRAGVYRVHISAESGTAIDLDSLKVYVDGDALEDVSLDLSGDLSAVESVIISDLRVGMAVRTNSGASVFLTGEDVTDVAYGIEGPATIWAAVDSLQLRSSSPADPVSNAGVLGIVVGDGTYSYSYQRTDLTDAGDAGVETGDGAAWLVGAGIDLPDEGTYSVSVTLGGTGGLYGYGSDDVSMSQSILVDATAPTIQPTATVDVVDEHANDTDPMTGGTLVASSDGVLRLSVVDAATGADATPSGVAKVSVTLPDSTELEAADAGGNVWEVTLPAGTYGLGMLVVKATDATGISATETITAINDGSDYYDVLLVEADGESEETATLGLATEVGEDDSYLDEETGVRFVREGAVDSAYSVRASVTSPNYEYFSSSWEASVSYRADAAQDDPTVMAMGGLQADLSSEVAYASTAELVAEAGDTLSASGRYEVAASWRGNDSSYVLVVDGTFPSVGGASVATRPALTASYEASAQGAAHLEWVGESLELAISVDDGDAAFASGTKAVTLSVPVSHTLAEDSPEESLGLPCELGSDGAWHVTLDHEVDGGEAGVTYFLDQATVVTSDNVGNVGTTDLTDVLDSSEGNVTRFHALPRSLAEVSSPEVEAVDADDAPASLVPGTYFRGDATLRVRVSDPLFDVLSHVPGYGLTVRLTVDEDGDGIPEQTRSLRSNEFQVAAGGWLTLDLGDDDDLPVEGVYEVEATYRRFGSPLTTDATFVFDRTAPELGPLMVEDDEDSEVDVTLVGRYLVSRMDQTLALDFEDPLAAVGEGGANVLLVDMWGNSEDGATIVRDSAGLRVSDDSDDGDDDQEKTVPFATRGYVQIPFAGDGSRLSLSDSTFSLTDRAGNVTEGSSGDLTLAELAAIDGANVPEDAEVLVIDTQAPAISLGYDNNDVRNGRYYNAGRVATITVVEKNFDLLQELYPNLVVATATVDGSESGMTLRTSDFQTTDGGTTWVATLDCSTDGDWVVSAGLTDIAGRSSESLEDGFTVDTLAPVITVDFDNDDVRNGMYYNATRTATVTVTERNFSADETIVTTTAEDADGNAQAAPGGSAFVDAGDYDHVSQTYFGGELHYGMTVQSTDLAGNVATEYEVPEFVIDMTAPEVDIWGIEDRHAYAGSVSPGARAYDINYDLSESEVSLTGAHAGEVSWMSGMTRDLSETGESFSVTDFSYELASDDVYTVVARAQDLAGNVASEEAVFSVNRFGSNYVFSADTEALRGAFLTEPRDVVVTEINVSGLVDGESRIDLTSGTEVSTLASGEEYSVEKGDDAGWSATTYTIPADLFDGDAFYRVTLTSEDLAGNLAQNTMEDKSEDRSSTASIAFAVDAAAPAASIVGAEDGGLYFGSSRTVSIGATDNVLLSSAVLRMDGQEVASWDAVELREGVSRFDIPADAEAHDLELEVVDRAGNVRVASLSNVTVASDLWGYLRANPSLLASLVGALVLVTGGLGITLTLAVRHHRRTASRRNPFAH